MQTDTRKLLTTGLLILLTGVAAVGLMLTLFGGITDHGPHTNSGWLALVIALGCVPTGLLTLALGAAKWFGGHRR